MFRTVALGLLALAAGAQTQIDLRTQAKGVDFTAATSTKPMKTGAALPARCSTGELFFKTDAPAGANVYACSAANIWSVQGAQTVQSGGVVVGTRATTNFSTGPGLLSLASDTGSSIDMLWALDTAVNQTQAGEQSGAALWCASNGGSVSAYACALTPTASAYTAGMTLHWRPDVNGAGGPTTLNVDTLGATPVKLADGTSDPGPSDILTGRLYDIWYDGGNFRLAPTTAAAVGALGDTGTNGVLYRSEPGAASAATADQMSGPFFCLDTASTAGAYACNLTPAIGQYNIGTTYWFRAGTANSGAATANFNSLGAKPIKKRSNVDPVSGDIAAGQWVMLTYDGTNMQMLSQTAAPSGVSSVFGRAGAVSAQSGDYTTAQVPESGNLYYTDARARAALTWSTLTGKPSAFAPSAHAASHQNGGSDEIAVAAPAANAIPKAGAGGTLAGGWLPAPGLSSLGGVRAMDCSATGLVQKINTDGTITCAAAGGSSAPSINTGYVKYEDDFTCGYSGTLCLPWFSNGAGQVNSAANGAWPHLGVFTIGGSAAAAGNLGYLMLNNYQNPATGLETFGGLLANGPWELHWIFRLNQTTNTKMVIGAHSSQGNGYDDTGIGVRFNTALGDTAFMLTAENGWGGGAVSSGIAADTNWHHLKIYWVSANRIAMTLDGGAPVTVCASGCTITDSYWGTQAWQYAASAECGSAAAAAQTTMDLDYFGFLATVGSR